MKRIIAILVIICLTSPYMLHTAAEEIETENKAFEITFGYLADLTLYTSK